MKRTAVTLLLGYAMGLLSLIGCATMWPYPFYAPAMPEACYDQGQLVGKQGKDGWSDIPLSECKPDDKVRLKCVISRIDDYYALKSDDQKCHSDLVACQKGPKPAP